jgi:signal transduction histidine kinase
VVIDFSIAPPWHRSRLAFACYGIGAVLCGCGLYYWAIRHTRRRNAILEKLVRDRTTELRSAMVRLNEETRHAATLAERNRLAGEIHDSLQQGLSGLMLQLDATLKLPDLAADVRSKLTVARNMVSFTRHEVQQAVWNLESPLLENADLADALRKLAGLISSGKPQVEIKTSGMPTDVSSSTKHQLLRIAQEAITNAVRHGNAQKIFVHLEYSGQEISLEIFDDGCGFVPKEVFASGIGHFGLRGLRGRALKLNADLKIISAPNRGTTVRIVLPLPRASTPANAFVASA